MPALRPFHMPPRSLAVVVMLAILVAGIVAGVAIARMLLN